MLIEGEMKGIPLAIAIECKKYSRRIDVGEIDAFIGKLQDLSVDRGAFYVYDGVSAGARTRAGNARHPAVLLRERVGDELQWEDLLPDCPGQNCHAGFVRWTESKQPAGGEDVEWGYCADCGSLVFRCRDCGDVEVGDGSTATCYTCMATYELRTTDYQTSTVGDVIQLTRGED